MMKLCCVALLASQVIHLIPLLTEISLSSGPALRSVEVGVERAVVVVQSVMGNGPPDPWR